MKKRHCIIWCWSSGIWGQHWRSDKGKDVLDWIPKYESILKCRVLDNSTLQYVASICTYLIPSNVFCLFVFTYNSKLLPTIGKVTETGDRGRNSHLIYSLEQRVEINAQFPKPGYGVTSQGWVPSSIINQDNHTHTDRQTYPWANLALDNSSVESLSLRESRMCQTKRKLTITMTVSQFGVHLSYSSHYCDNTREERFALVQG